MVCTTEKLGTNLPDWRTTGMDRGWWLLFPMGLWLVPVMSKTLGGSLMTKIARAQGYWACQTPNMKVNVNALCLQLKGLGY